MSVKHLGAAREPVTRATTAAHPIAALAQETVPVSINGPALTVAPSAKGEESGGVTPTGANGVGNRNDGWGLGGEGVGGMGSGGIGNGIGAGTGSGGNLAAFVKRLSLHGQTGLPRSRARREAKRDKFAPGFGR